MTARTTETMALGGVLIALVLAIAADPLVQLLGGDEYGPAGDVLRIQALVMPFVFLSAGWTPTLLGMGRTRVLMAACAAGLVALLGAGLALIPAHEAHGAAIAAVAGDVTMCAVTYVLLVRVGPGRSISLAAMGRVVLAAVPAVALGALDVGPDLARAALAAVVFLACALLLRAVPQEILDAVRGAAARRPRR
jgi:O-antigen/teichoic acid export membrane protein